MSLDAGGRGEGSDHGLLFGAHWRFCSSEKDQESSEGFLGGGWPWGDVLT